MKNRIVEMVQGILAILVFILLLGVCGYIETHYTMDAEIVDIKGDEVKIEDSVGETFVFYGQGYKVGDNVKVTFSTNYTDDIRQDDKVVKVKGL